MLNVGLAVHLALTSARSLALLSFWSRSLARFLVLDGLIVALAVASAGFAPSVTSVPFVLVISTRAVRLSTGVPRGGVIIGVSEDEAV